MNNKGIMEQKNKLIPELRFPEFVKDGEWEIKTLNEIAKFRRGSFPQPYGLPEWYDVNGFPFIQVFDVDDNFKLKTNTKSKISKAAAEQSVFIKKGTVIVTIQGSIGRVAITQYDAYIDRTLLLFEEYFKEINQVYFSYVLFKLFEIEKEKAPGGIIKTITKEVLSDFKINIPKYNEQQKIADCLSSLDEVITAHNDKLETLKNHKKGLLQNLFPQEGQTTPNYRFPEFMNDGDWEIKTVSEVAYYENGKAHEQHIIINGKYKVVNSKFISTDGEVVKYTNEALCLANINDTLMVLSDVPNGRAIAKCFYVDKNNTYTVNQRICKLKPLDINGKILYYLLNRNPYFLAFDDGVKQTNLKNDDVLNCEIVLPKKTKIQKEQQKIADCLLAVDNLITSQTDKIEQLKAHKKGLMQGLFPKMSE